IIKLNINGHDAGEALISALTAGCFGVPVGMATGDRAFIDEVKTFLPLIETVAVKEARGNFAALNLHPERSAEQIKVAANTAVKKGIKGVFKPLRFDEPVEMRLELVWPGYADALGLVPGVERRAGREISFNGGWLEALELISLFVNWIRVVPGIFDKFK
ncbi:MAG: D-aminopeptidase, partial [Pelotomaculum thermopropionicum]